MITAEHFIWLDARNMPIETENLEIEVMHRIRFDYGFVSGDNVKGLVQI